MKEKKQKGKNSFVAVIALLLMVIFMKHDVQAAQTITGGDSRENAVQISADTDYVSTNADGWYKIDLPENVYAVGAERDQFTGCLFYIGEVEYQIYNTDSASIVDSQYESGKYFESAYGNDVYAGQTIYFNFYTTKADNCRFKVLVGTTYSFENASIMSLNEDITTVKPYSTNCYYKFVAPTSGKYKLTVSSESGDAEVEYKDGNSVSNSWDKIKTGQKWSTVFNVTQGMTYYVHLSLSEKKSMTFSVSNVKVSSISLNMKNLTMNREQTFLLEATAYPENAVDSSVSFSSSNPDVASVSSDGWITANSAGNAVITAAAEDGSGVTESCAVTVNPVAVEKITLDCTSLSFDYWDVRDYPEDYEEDLFLGTEIEPEDADNKNVVFSSSDSSVVTVDKNGNLELKGAGTAVITCTAQDGFGASTSCTVTVIKNLEKGSKFTVDGLKYKVTSYPTDTVQTVTVCGLQSKTGKNYNIPKTVRTNGENFRVTEISASAFSGCKKAVSITVGENVTKIGKNAFAKCKSLKKIVIKSKKITSVGEGSLSGINKNARIKVPAAKYKKYTTLFANKGQKSSVKITK